MTLDEQIFSVVFFLWLKHVKLQQKHDAVVSLWYLPSWTHLIGFSDDWAHELLKETTSIVLSYSYPSALSRPYSAFDLLNSIIFLSLFHCRLCLFPINYPVEHPHRSSHTPWRPTLWLTSPWPHPRWLDIRGVGKETESERKSSVFG